MGMYCPRCHSRVSHKWHYKNVFCDDWCRKRFVEEWGRKKIEGKFGETTASKKRNNKRFRESREKMKKWKEEQDEKS